MKLLTQSIKRPIGVSMTVEELLAVLKACDVDISVTVGRTKADLSFVDDIVSFDGDKITICPIGENVDDCFTNFGEIK